MANQANKGAHSNPMKVITGPNTRWSYANIWEAKSINGGAPKFSVSLIIPKSDAQTVTRVRAAIEAAYRDGEAKLKGNGKTMPALAVLKSPLRDGDTERPDDPAYANAYFINANKRDRPGRRGRRSPAHLRAFRSVQRRVRQGQHQLLRLQQQRQQGNRLRAEQPAEDSRRRTAWRKIPARKMTSRRTTPG